MLTLLAVIGVLAVLFVAAVVATRNDAVLIDVLPDAADLDLPTTAIQAEDLNALRFSQALRGYRMDEVDGVLERVAVELAARDRRLGALQAELVTARRGRPAESGPGVAQPSPVAAPQATASVATPTPPTTEPPSPLDVPAAQDGPADRHDSPLTGFSLPDISPPGWTAGEPAEGPAEQPDQPLR